METLPQNLNHLNFSQATSLSVMIEIWFIAGDIRLAWVVNKQ